MSAPNPAPEPGPSTAPVPKSLSGKGNVTLAGTLFATDLDGTLLDETSQVSDQSARMLNEAIGRGAQVTVATARTPATVSRLLSEVNLRLPLVVMTGAALWDPVSDRYLHTCFHRERDVRSLIDIYRRHGLPTFTYTLRDHRIHIHHIGPLSDAERQFIDERLDSPYKTFHVPDDGESRLPERLDNVLLMFALQPAGPAAEAYAEIKTLPGINTVFYHDLFDPSTAFIEAFPEEATKAKGLGRLRAHIGAERLVAYGDNFNDLPMFRAADEAVAVGNAVEEVRREATRTIGPNTADSVARDILEQARLISAAPTPGDEAQ